MSRCTTDVHKHSHKLVLKLKGIKHRDDEEKWKLEKFSASLFTILPTRDIKELVESQYLCSKC